MAAPPRCLVRRRLRRCRISRRQPNAADGSARTAAIQGSGQAAGPVVAGWLLTRAGFTETFFVAAGFGGLAFVLLASWKGSSDRRVPLAWADVVFSVREVARDSRILLTSLAQAGQFVLHGMMNAFLPIYAVEQVGLSAAQAGLLFGAQMTTTILARPVFGRVSDSVGRRPMIVGGLVICSGAVALFASSSGFAALLGCSAVYGTGLAITTSSTAALITDLTDRSRYGAAHGLFGTIFDVGDGLGPLAGGVVAARYGYQTLFYASAALVVCLAATFGVLSRRWQP